MAYNQIERAYDLAYAGATDAMIAEALGMTEAELEEERKRRPKLDRAILSGREHSTSYDGKDFGRGGNPSTGTGASMTLDFVNNIYQRDGVLFATLADLLAVDGLVFTRASTGYTLGNTSISQFAIDAPRINANGLLYEPAATNLLIRSTELDNAIWGKFNGATVTANSFSGPDGAATGDTVTAGTGFGGLTQDATYAAGAYTVSIWGKLIAGFPALLFQIASATGTDKNLTSALVRYSETLSPGSGIRTLNMYVDSATGNNAGYWGAQVELGTRATSYIPTTTAAASRATDALPIKQRPGKTSLRVTFDDLSTQDVAQAAGVTATLSTALNRPQIRSIVAM